MKGDAFKSIEQIAFALNFGEAKVQLTGEAVAGSEKDASALADVVKFVVGIVQLNRDNKETADMAAVLDTLEVKASGSTVKLTLAVPEAQVENLIRGKSDKQVVRKISAEK
jgi:dsRNA-specific ribonuclease